MNYRKAVLLDAEDCSTDGTKTLDLKGLDPISRIIIQLKALNNTATPVAHPAAAITKVELVDGSDVLWSLNGYEAQALNYYQNGKKMPDLINYFNAEYYAAVVPISFGRWLWDEDIAFDPSRFKNPQLKVTHDISLGGSGSAAATLDVDADLFDDRHATPMGWLMAKEYNAYTIVASAQQKIELPTDYLMRMVMIQSLYSTNQPWQQYHDIKLSENNAKKIVIDEETSDLIKYILQEYDPYIERIRTQVTTGSVNHFVTPTMNVGYSGNLRPSDGGYAEFNCTHGGTVAVQGSAAGQCNFMADGYCPHGALPLLFGDLWEPALWYDVTKLAKLDLLITAGSGASGTIQVVTEQLRRF